MADGKTKAKNPRFFAFDAIDLNTYLAKKGVLGNVEEMGKFFQSMLNDLLSGCVREGCDEFVKGEIFGHAEERMLTKRKQNQEYYQKRKNGVPDAEPVPMVDDAEPTVCDDGIAPAPIDADYNPLGLKNPHGTYNKLFFTRDEMDVFASVANTVKNPTAVVQSAINEISKSLKLRSLHISEADRVDAVDRITKRIRYVTGQKNELAVAQAKLDTANVYKAAQDAKPKMFQ